MGNEKRYAILALRDQKPVCLVSLQYGYVRMSDEGDILLNVEDYDGMYEPYDDGGGAMMLHTWKDSYLYYEDGAYKEYGAARITETEFVSYQHAQTLKEIIEEELYGNRMRKLKWCINREWRIYRHRMYFYGGNKDDRR